MKFDPAEIDASLHPGNDFFGYVNNVWIKNNPMPPEESRWGSFNILHVEVEQKLKKIVDDISVGDGSALDASGKKVRDFYRTGMDMEKRNMAKDAPLKDFFEVVRGIKDGNDLARVLGFLHRHGVGALWIPFADQDQKKSEMVAMHFYQGGLSLPDRDYYIKDDAMSAEIRKKYLAYIGTVSAASALAPGLPAQKIMDMETALAKASMTRVEQRDVEKLYNKMAPADLAMITPSVNWAVYFEAIGLAMPEYMIVCQPEFMKEADRFIKENSLEDIKQYLSWHVINVFAGFLSEEFETMAFDFYGRTFRGTKEMKVLWRRVLTVVNMMLEQALGKLYVERHFGEEAKRKVNALVNHLIAAYRARIEKLDWMTPETKEKALAKLATVTRKLGYPDTWRDISALEITDESYVKNYINAYAFEFDRQMKKIGKPVDRNEWLMPPQMVNAYYQPPLNDIAFPAAILQPPFFDPGADDALNFGGIGTVIGHELTHGFDDQGSLYDLQGNLNNWWSKEDRDSFEKQTARFVGQYDAYEPLPGLHVNGKLTLGENIADLGGILIAYDGLQLMLAEKGSAPIDGLTPNQRFFINYAVSERGMVRDEALRLQVQTDPHAPSKYRVNGPLSNMPEFYEAFAAKEGNELYRDPKDRVNIW